MRDRPRLLLTVARAIVVGATLVVLAGACSVNAEGGDNRLGVFQDRARGDLGDEATDEALDRRFAGFVAQGNLDPLEADAAREAEERTVECEERQCGIDVG